MIITAKELIAQGETEYSIRKKVSTKELYLVERGMYSDEPFPFINEAYLCKKYPHAVLTGLSAYCLYDLTDSIPDKFYFATEQHSFPIRRKDVVQSYQEPSIFPIGITHTETDAGKVQIYDLERMLIETIRLRERLPADLYYEVIESFRKRKDELDFYTLAEYLKRFRNGNMLLYKIKGAI